MFCGDWLWKVFNNKAVSVLAENRCRGLWEYVLSRIEPRDIQNDNKRTLAYSRLQGKKQSKIVFDRNVFITRKLSKRSHFVKSGGSLHDFSLSSDLGSN